MNTATALHFVSMPTFHQLWDACMESHLSYTEASFAEFEGALARLGITRASSILDTCAGGGSLDVELLKRGYDLTTMDGDSGMLELFQGKLAALGIEHAPTLAKWQDLPKSFEGKRFDAMICCGNSLIYAGGHWNSDGAISREASLEGILETLMIFRAQLKSGGVLLLDKPMDDEEPVEERVARLCIAGQDWYDVFFSVRFNETRLCRTGQILLRHQITNVETGVPNVAYHLKDAELVALLRNAGFASVERTACVANDRFPLWIVRA